MKYSLLFTLLVSAPLMADSYKEAQTKLDTAQGRVSECKRKVDGLSSRVEGTHRETQDMAGKYEYSQDMNSRKEAVRRNIDEYNKAVQELEQASKHLQGIVQEMGRNYRLVENNESYTVMDNQKEQLEPIVTKARPSYERSTKSYSKNYQE
ncbi:hypothetical protein H0W26_01285 [Candidatus Dependentiae bacterium]|nr:hypothetical protein [Candidatus Dependentiae bacterium]